MHSHRAFRDHAHRLEIERPLRVRDVAWLLLGLAAIVVLLVLVLAIGTYP